MGFWCWGYLIALVFSRIKSRFRLIGLHCWLELGLRWVLSIVRLGGFWLIALWWSFTSLQRWGQRLRVVIQVVFFSFCLFSASLSPKSSGNLDPDVTRCPICRCCLALEEMPAHIGKEILQLNHVTPFNSDLDPKRRRMRHMTSPRSGPHMHTGSRYQVKCCSIPGLHLAIKVYTCTLRHASLHVCTLTLVNLKINIF